MGRAAGAPGPDRWGAEPRAAGKVAPTRASAERRRRPAAGRCTRIPDVDPIERLVATEAIRQLAARYAVCLDARDLDGLVGLYPPGVRAAGGRTGRDALREDFDRSLRGVGITFLQVGNHVIDFRDDHHATGIVYCRGEIQDGGRESDRWIVQAIQYHDDYACVDGDWYFTRRRHLLVYGAELGENPLALEPAEWPARQTGMGSVPHDLETWRRFWGLEPL